MDCLVFFFFFFFFFFPFQNLLNKTLTAFFFGLLSFEGHTRGIQRFPGQELNQSCNCWPMPQPQQRGIWAASMTYTIAHGNAGSLTPWWVPGIEPTSSCILVSFINHWAMTGTQVKPCFLMITLGEWWSSWKSYSLHFPTSWLKSKHLPSYLPLHPPAARQTHTTRRNLSLYGLRTQTPESNCLNSALALPPSVSQHI